MKQFIEAFKTARKTEIILIAAALCALLFCLTEGNTNERIATEEELRIQHILSQIEGAGEVQVMISTDETGAYQGAIIAAVGAEQIYVKLELLQAMHTLTGMDLEQIDVVESKR